MSSESIISKALSQLDWWLVREWNWLSDHRSWICSVLMLADIQVSLELKSTTYTDPSGTK